MSQADLELQVRQLKEQLASKQVQIDKFQAHLARANVQLQQVLSHVQRYIEVVHQLHHELVPSKVAQIRGFDFSYKFVPGSRGGDFFDVVKIEDSSKFAILLASCASSQQSAQLLMFLLQSPLSKQKQQKAENILDQVLKYLGSEGADKLNLFCAVMDRRDFSCQYAQTGHNMCWHYQQDKGQAVALQAQGGFRLEACDKIVLSTPGLIEAQNDQGQAFGMERWLNILKQKGTLDAHKLRHEILFQLEQWQAQAASLGRDKSVFICQAQDKVTRLKVAV